MKTYLGRLAARAQLAPTRVSGVSLRSVSDPFEETAASSPTITPPRNDFPTHPHAGQNPASSAPPFHSAETTSISPLIPAVERPAPSSHSTLNKSDSERLSPAEPPKQTQTLWPADEKSLAHSIPRSESEAEKNRATHPVEDNMERNAETRLRPAPLPTPTLSGTPDDEMETLLRKADQFMAELKGTAATEVPEPKLAPLAESPARMIPAKPTGRALYPPVETDHAPSVTIGNLTVEITPTPPPSAVTRPAPRRAIARGASRQSSGGLKSSAHFGLGQL